MMRGRAGGAARSADGGGDRQPRYADVQAVTPSLPAPGSSGVGSRPAAGASRLALECIAAQAEALLTDAGGSGSGGTTTVAAAAATAPSALPSPLPERLAVMVRRHDAPCVA
jgi:hypothetical protein